MKEISLKNQVQELTNKLEAGIKDIFESSRYKEYLKTMSKFHNYSLNNVILISMQKADATLVCGYKAWQNLHGRQVVKGAKAIKILAPAPYKIKVEKNKINAKTGKAELDADGKLIKETVEVQVPNFKVVNVFDISQTEGRELPALGHGELEGEVKEYNLLFRALEETCPIPIEFEAITSSAKGYFNPQDQRIVIKEGMSQIQTIKTVIHEMAHQKLHDGEIKKTRNSKEVEAESVAYVICQHYGVDTSDYSFTYIAGWSSDKVVPELKESLNTIRKATSEMITRIDEKFQEYAAEAQIQKRIQDKAASVQGICSKSKESILEKLCQKQERAVKWEGHEKTRKEKEVTK